MILFAIIYFIGCLLSYWMLRVDLEAENEQFTYGSRAIAIVLSILSFVMVLFTLISAWVGKIQDTGYWKRPIKKTAEPE